MTDVAKITNALIDFITYVDDFYNAKSGIYPIKGMTDLMVIEAVQKYIKEDVNINGYVKDFCGDSVDRERIRDIILADNGLEWS
jgi:hypothetical protein